MNPTLLLLLLAVAALFCVALALHITRDRLRSGEVHGANIAEGTHKDALSGYADAAITTRHLLYKRGVAATTFAVAGVNDVALGTIADEVATADIAAVPVTLQLLGKGPTKRMVASEAMATTGVPVYQAASGKIALSGSRQVGFLITTASADGDVVEVLDRVSVVQDGVETLTAARVLTVNDSGKTFFLNAAGGFDITLPALATPAFTAKFIVLTAPTTAYTITGATADKIVGHVLSSSGAAEDTETTAGGDVINFVANTAVIGDQVTIDMNGTLYFASARCAAAGGITITG